MNITKKTITTPTVTQTNSTQNINIKNKIDVLNNIKIDSSIAKSKDNPTIESSENLIQLNY